jgi:hypothetical protein
VWDSYWLPAVVVDYEIDLMRVKLSHGVTFNVSLDKLILRDPMRGERTSLALVGSMRQSLLCIWMVDWKSVHSGRKTTIIGRCQRRLQSWISRGLERKECSHWVMENQLSGPARLSARAL